MKIDRNIPLPTEAQKPRKLRVPVESMEVGDSIFFPGAKRVSALATVRATAMRAGLPFNFKSAAVDGGVRVWRVV
ncbi:hypothetical protein LZK98_11765 [Sphingomonas cannabina]|uniref:hypothetical protein n=1 Tax=Sphingomonas cannabina TaxID=2899123 RepID=UPI001F271489|nr:hypothetical protein [Sphingomonas cannabina]UIJ43768.1 hypothetical protein LZK98_11765 [Sphingomonas cannabina]